MVKRKEGEKVCYFCSKYVNTKKDHYVLLGTYNRSTSPNDEQFFHFSCFLDWFMNKVTNRSKLQVEQMRNHVMHLIDNPMIKGILSQVQGSGQLTAMLQTPLPQSPEKLTKKVILKIEDDRKKRAKGKRRKSTKM
jgi:hypothetical protein